MESSDIRSCDDKGSSPGPSHATTHGRAEESLVAAPSSAVRAQAGALPPRRDPHGSTRAVVAPWPRELERVSANERGRRRWQQAAQRRAGVAAVAARAEQIVE